MAEIELTPESVEVGDNIYNSQVSFSDINQRKSLTADMAVSTVSSGGDLVQSVQDTATLSAEEIRTNATIGYQDDQRQLLTDTIEFTAVEQPDNLANVVTNAPKQFSEIEKAGLSKLTPYVHWVNSLEGSEKLSDDEKKSIAVDSLLLEAITSGSDKRAWYENTWDVLGLMAVPDESYNAAEIQANLFNNEIGFTEWLGSRDAYENIAGFRSSLSPEERVMFDERLVEVIQGVDDNKLQQIGSVMAVIGLDPNTKAFQDIEKFDALFIGSQLGRGLFKGLRSLNVLNRTARSGDSRATMKTADAVTSDRTVAKEAGVSQMDAANVGNPVKPSGIFTGAPEGLQKEYRMYSKDVGAALDKATDTLVITARPGTKDADEIAAAVKRNLSKNDDMDNLEVTVGLEGINIKYDVLDVDSVTTVREQRLFTLDDIGGFEQKEAGFMASGLRFATSPNTLAGKDRKLFVQQAEAALFAKGRIGKSYTEAVDISLKPVKGNVKSLKKIDYVMRQVDGTDIQLDYHTLVNEGIGGTRVSDKEFIAITGLRRVLDDAWYTNNTVIRREMELRGSKKVTIDDDVQFAKPYKDPDSGYKVFSSDTENTIIVDADGITHKGMGLDELKLHYNNGKVLVKADAANPQEWFTSSDGFVKYALVNKSSIQDLPSTVLNKVKNYLPKLREDANYFVKQQRGIIVDGVSKKLPSTVAYAATEGQALRYLAKLRKTSEEAGEEFVEGDWSVVFDREVNIGSASADTLAVSGGLIRGKRKSTELDWAGDLDEGGRTDALDAIQRYMGITSDRVAMSEWRLEARARVINQAAANESIGDKAKRVDWSALRADIASSNADPQEKAKLLGMHDQVSAMSGIPTKTDQAFQGAVKAIGKKFDRAGREGTAKYFYKMHDKSLIDVLKGATFNLTLGTFSLVQIPVQLLGASVAVSINPIAAVKATPRWLMSSMMDFVTNEKTARKYLEKTAKDQGLDVATLANDYSAWRKSGMFEAVVRGSADASSIANRLPYDAGFLRKGFHAAIEAGQAPYRMGELSNMRISFFTALEREKGLRGKAFKYDDAMIGRVVSRAEQYRLNMSGANKAAFQKGIWALPTQFKQIYTKYIEAMTGTHFSGNEKARLFIGQAALFGAAGVPIINHFTDETLVNVFGLDTGDLTAEQLIIAKRGAIGWQINHEMGLDALISGRLTVSADVIEDVRRALIDENTPMFKSMLGASFTSGDKFVDFFSNMILSGNMVLDEYLSGEDLGPALKVSSDLMLRSLANIPSSSRKWMAAYDLSQGYVRNADGVPLYSLQPDLGDVYARGIGFSSQEMDDLYKLSTADRNRKTEIKDLATRYIAILYDMENAVTNQDTLTTEGAQIASSLIKRQIDRLAPEDAKEVMDSIISRISKPRDFREETLNKAILNAVGEFTDSANKVSIIKQKFIEDNELGGQ